MTILRSVLEDVGIYSEDPYKLGVSGVFSECDLPANSWPGLYTLVYVDEDGLELCAECASKHEEYSSTVVGVYALFEDCRHCDNCYEVIVASYCSSEEDHSEYCGMYEGISE